MKWNILDTSVSSDISEIQKVLLEHREIRGVKETEKFLHPKLSDINYDQLGIDTQELEKASRRIQKAIKEKESVIVYTDYDVDGISSGAIVWETLFHAGARVLPHVPHRIDEGYGLTLKGIDHVRKEFGATLIITVDHGITAQEKIDYAKNQGIDTIVMDHHTRPKRKLSCFACIHTTKLCATGLAYIFANFFRQILKLRDWKRKKNIEFDEKNSQFLDLVALATIADLVPLTHENRVLATCGLRELNRTKRIGLKALIAESGLMSEEIGEYEVGHILAPRINALGRLSHAIDALRLLCTYDLQRAKKLASLLTSTNRNRQELTEELLFHAKAYVGKLLEIQKGKKPSLLFLSHETYNPGIIGLIAGKLADEYHIPAVVVSQGEVYSKASARSVKGINIVEVIREAHELLVDVGGHPMAAGFTVETKKIDILQRRLIEIIQKQKPGSPEKELDIDLFLPFLRVDEELFKFLQKLRPFGKGNEEPIFAAKNVYVEKIRLVGKDGKHLKMILRYSGADTINNDSYEAIGFGMGALIDSVSFGSRLDIAFTVSKNTWNGSSHLQLKLRDAMISDLQ